MALLLQKLDPWIEDSFCHACAFVPSEDVASGVSGDGDDDDDVSAHATFSIPNEQSQNEDSQNTIPAGLLGSPPPIGDGSFIPHPSRKSKIVQVMYHGGSGWNAAAKKGSDDDSPPYLVVHDGRYSAVAFLSSDTMAGLGRGVESRENIIEGASPNRKNDLLLSPNTRAGRAARREGEAMYKHSVNGTHQNMAPNLNRALISITHYTISTILLCTGSNRRHSLLLRYISDSLHTNIRHQINMNLCLCLYISGPINIIGAENQGLIGDAKDVHNSARLRQALQSHQREFHLDGESEIAGLANNSKNSGEEMMREDYPHRMMVRKLETCHCFYRRQAMEKEKKRHCGLVLNYHSVERPEQSSVGREGKRTGNRRSRGRRKRKHSGTSEEQSVDVGSGVTCQTDASVEIMPPWPWKSRTGMSAADSSLFGNVHQLFINHGEEDFGSDLKTPSSIIDDEGNDDAVDKDGKESCGVGRCVQSQTDKDESRPSKEQREKEVTSSIERCKNTSPAAKHTAEEANGTGAPAARGIEFESDEETESQSKRASIDRRRCKRYFNVIENTNIRLTQNTSSGKDRSPAQFGDVNNLFEQFGDAGEFLDISSPPEDTPNDASSVNFPSSPADATTKNMTTASSISEHKDNANKTNPCDVQESQDSRLANDSSTCLDTPNYKGSEMSLTPGSGGRVASFVGIDQMMVDEEDEESENDGDDDSVSMNHECNVGEENGDSNRVVVSDSDRGGNDTQLESQLQLQTQEDMENGSSILRRDLKELQHPKSPCHLNQTKQSNSTKHKMNLAGEESLSQIPISYDEHSKHGEHFTNDDADDVSESQSPASFQNSPKKMPKEMSESPKPNQNRPMQRSPSQIPIPLADQSKHGDHLSSDDADDLSESQTSASFQKSPKKRPEEMCEPPKPNQNRPIQRSPSQITVLFAEQSKHGDHLSSDDADDLSKSQIPLSSQKLSGRGTEGNIQESTDDEDSGPESQIPLISRKRFKKSSDGKTEQSRRESQIPISFMKHPKHRNHPTSSEDEDAVPESQLLLSTQRTGGNVKGIQRNSQISVVLNPSLTSKDPEEDVSVNNVSTRRSKPSQRDPSSHSRENNGLDHGSSKSYLPVRQFNIRFLRSPFSPSVASSGTRCIAGTDEDQIPLPTKKRSRSRTDENWRESQVPIMLKPSVKNNGTDHRTNSHFAGIQVTTLLMHPTDSPSVASSETRSIHGVAGPTLDEDEECLVTSSIFEPHHAAKDENSVDTNRRRGLSHSTHNTRRIQSTRKKTYDSDDSDEWMKVMKISTAKKSVSKEGSTKRNGFGCEVNSDMQIAGEQSEEKKSTHRRRNTGNSPNAPLVDGQDCARLLEKNIGHDDALSQSHTSSRNRTNKSNPHVRFSLHDKLLSPAVSISNNSTIPISPIIKSRTRQAFSSPGTIIGDHEHRSSPLHHRFRQQKEWKKFDINRFLAHSKKSSKQPQGDLSPCENNLVDDFRNTETSGIPMAIDSLLFGESQQVQRWRSTRLGPRTPDVPLICSAAISGHTPGKVTEILSEEFRRRCDKCLGFIYAKQVTDEYPNGRRQQCYLCHRKTSWFCSGCRRSLCNEPRKDTATERFAKTFEARVPKLDSSGKLEMKNGKIVFAREKGNMSCYIAAHQCRWNEYFGASGMLHSV